MSADNKEKMKALEYAVGSIEKQFGKGSIIRLGADTPRLAVETVSSGSLSLDIALGTGGLPKGRIVEIYGPESSGKTTMTLHAIAEAQRSGGVCAFVDAEHALDTSYAEKIGVNLEDLLVSQPDTGEQALEIVEMLVRSGAVDVVVVDSVAALTPKAELDGDMGDRHVGLQARLMSQALRKLTGLVNRSKCLVVFINQLRTKIGVTFGNPETTTGGNALKFYSSVRLDIRRIASIKVAESPVGNRVKIKVVKNKLAAPFKQVEFDIMFNKGISLAGDILDLAVAHDIVKKSGSWFSYGDERLGQGREGVKALLEEHPGMADRIRQDIMKSCGMELAQRQGASAGSDQAASSPVSASASSQERGKKRSKSSSASSEVC